MVEREEKKNQHPNDVLRAHPNDVAINVSEVGKAALRSH